MTPAGGKPPPGDDRPAGDPRDPRFDPLPVTPARRARDARPRASRRRLPRRRLPRWPFLILAVLTVTAFASQPRLLLADLGATLDALGFALLIGAPLVLGVLWADRRWPAGRRRERPDPPAAAGE